MAYSLVNFLHVLGAILIGAGLIGVWVSDLRSRQVRDLIAFSEAVRNIALFYDGVVIPGALLLLFTGAWMTIRYYGGSGVLEHPWLAAMIVLFALEFIEGNTITRRYFMRLRRAAGEALRQGSITEELERTRAESLPTYTHFLDLPVLFLIVALGSIKPTTWTPFFSGLFAAVAVAAVLTRYIPRLLPWAKSGGMHFDRSRG